MAAVDAPSAVRAAVVTSALAEMPSSLVPSVATLRPSNVPVIVTLPVMAGVARVLLDKVSVDTKDTKVELAPVGSNIVFDALAEWG
tara:strand:+ start:1732 stop:1989 length:258 start_codon:yes stop_codon:yes gene_type:complete